MGLYLHSQRSKIQSGPRSQDDTRIMRPGRSCFHIQRIQRAFVLVIRTGELEGLLSLECHRLRGDRDNMVRRTLKVGRDLKPPCNPGLNGVLLVSIDEEMCPLRFQRQQRHVDHGQTHASATSCLARYYYIGIVNRVCDTSNRQRTESETTRGSYIHFRSEMNDVRMTSSRT